MFFWDKTLSWHKIHINEQQWSESEAAIAFIFLKSWLKMRKDHLSFPAMSHINMRLLNALLLREIKMLQENKVSSEILDTWKI